MTPIYLLGDGRKPENLEEETPCTCVRLLTDSNLRSGSNLEPWSWEAAVPPAGTVWYCFICWGKSDDLNSAAENRELKFPKK